LRKLPASLYLDIELKEQIRQTGGSEHIPYQKRSRKYWI